MCNRGTRINKGEKLKNSSLQTRFYHPMDNMKQSNFFIQSKYKISTLGNKLMILGLFQLQKGNYSISEGGGNNLKVDIPAKVIKDSLGWTGNSIYSNLDRISKSLLNCSFGYKDPEIKEFRYINLFTEIVYRNGEFSVVFNGDLREHLTVLENNYTILNLPLMMGWQRAYTFRLFEILASEAYKFENLGYNCRFEMDLAEFKFLIGCYDINDPDAKQILKNKKISSTDFEAAEVAIVEANLKESKKVDAEESKRKKSVKQYFKWYDFKRNVLDQAINEINATPEADMIIDEIIPHKSGRGGKVKSIEILYRTHINDSAVEVVENKEMSEDEQLDFIIDLKDLLSDVKLKSSELKKIAEASAWDFNKCQKAVEMLNENKGTVSNVVAWLITAIKEDWEKPVKKTNTEVRYRNQRVYTEEFFENLINQ